MLVIAIEIRGGRIADFAKLNAEPGFAPFLPDKPTEFNDPLLTESEVARLRLDAYWGVLSAATPPANKSGAETRLGLAPALF